MSCFDLGLIHSLNHALSLQCLSDADNVSSICTLTFVKLSDVHSGPGIFPRPQLTTQHNSAFWLLCCVFGLCKRWLFYGTIVLHAVLLRLRTCIRQKYGILDYNLLEHSAQKKLQI